MIDYIVQFVILSIGIAATWYFAKFYFQKSKTFKKLSIILQNSTNTISVQNDVKDSLEIKYNNEIVSQLIQLQFIIKNDGNISIANIKSPLTFEIPSNYNLVSIEIPHIYPEGRKVYYKVLEDGIEYNFDILNKDEYFIVNKMFSIPDEPNANHNLISDYQFSVTAEELPPIFKVPNSGIIDNLEINLVKPLEQIKWLLLAVMRVVLFFVNFGGILILTLLTKISISNPDLNIFSPKEFFTNFNIWSIVILVGWGLSILLIVSTLGLVFEGWRKKLLKNETLKDKLKSLPENILK